MEWYAVQTKSRQENTAKQNLANQGFSVFLPTLRVPVKRGGKWSLQIEALFPGYLFLELDFGVQNTSSIRSTRGVIKLVKNGTQILPVSVELIAGLMKAQAAVDTATAEKQIFEAGEEVLLTTGAMSGLKGIYKSKNSEERVVLLLNILGDQTQVSVSQSHIAKVS